MKRQWLVWGWDGGDLVIAEVTAETADEAMAQVPDAYRAEPKE
jgi:hypothetical protein